MIGICGASGFIGRELYQMMKSSGERVLGTYFNNPLPGLVKFDLRQRDFTIFDKCEFVIVASAYAKIKFCQENVVEAFFLNVLQTCRLLEHLNERGIPALFISSDAAERLMETNYGKYKRMVEKYIKKKKLKCSYIRPGKITKENITELCEDMYAQACAYKGRKDNDENDS
jgi:nucleoside-diphosphate-sugar epimerase